MLRKVCQKFRQAIDNHPADFPCQKMVVDVDSNAVYYSLDFDGPEGCDAYPHHKDQKFGMNFGDDFIQDLQLTLRHQKSPMKKLVLMWKASEDLKLDKFQSVWENRKKMIKIKEIVLSWTNVTPIFTVLPFVDPHELQSIRIWRIESKITMDDLNKMSELDQWKTANKIIFEHSMTDSSCLAKFLHANANLAEVQVNVLHVNDCLLVKDISFFEWKLIESHFRTFQAVQNAPRRKRFQIGFVEFPEKEQFINMLGESPFEEEWFFKLPQSDEIFHVRGIFATWTFSRKHPTELTQPQIDAASEMF